MRGYWPVLCFASALGGGSLTAWTQEVSFDLGSAVPAPPAQPLFVSSIEGGLGYLGRDASHFGRYGGPAGNGLHLILNAAMDGGSVWNAERATFWNADAAVLGFDAMAARIRGGVQGRWRTSLFYDGFTRSFSRNARTPFLGAGSASLTLPADWVAGASSAQFTALESNLRPLDLAVEWRTVGGDLILTRGRYELRLNAGHRDREGLRPQSLAFGHEANFPVGVFFPQPVDYDTDQAGVALAFADHRLQWNASYGLSVFTNRIDAVRVPNPYSRSGGTPWPAGGFAGYPIAVGQYGLPPSSVAHQLLMSGAYTVSSKLRFTGRAAYTLQRQDEEFLPYTPVMQLDVPEALPRTSLDGKVRRFNLALGATLRPSRTVDVAASYTLDDRDNRSPSDLYSYVPNEAADQPRPLVPGVSRYIRRNLPHSFTFHQAKVEAGVRLAPRTRVSLTYSGDFRARTLQQVSDTSEHTLRAKILRTFNAGSVWLALTGARRTGSVYNDALPWDLSHTDSYLDASPFNQSIEHPLLRKYNLADRGRYEVSGGLTHELSAAFVLDVTGRYARDDYDRSPLGLQRSQTIAADANLSYLVANGASISAFYGIETIRLAQTGYIIGSRDLSNPQQDWSTRSRDVVHTLGFKSSWQAMPDKLTLGAGYYLADATGSIGVSATPFVIYTVTAPLPDVRDVTHNAEFTAEYRFRPDVSVRIGYTIQGHRGSDWQVDGLGFAPVAQILGSGIESPRYTAHFLWAATRYRF